MERTCLDFLTFGTCFHGRSCARYMHERPTNTRYIVDVVIGLEANTIELQHACEKYLIPNGTWHRRDVCVGDLVVFHYNCKKEPGRRKVGRVAFILDSRSSQDSGCEKNWTLPELRVIENAFTIDDVGTRNMEDAFSIENCKKHHNCKEIGIHVITAAANRLQKVSHGLLPCFTQRKQPLLFQLRSTWKYGRVDPNSLSDEKECLAISVFCHSKSEHVTGPTITVLQHTKNYYSDKLPPQEFLILQDHFVKPGTMTTGKMWKYVANFPDTYRSFVLLDMATSAYLMRVRAYLDSKAYAITKARLVTDVTSGSYTVLSLDCYKAATEILHKSPEEAIHRLMAGVNHLGRGHRIGDYVKDLKYIRDVQRTSFEASDRTVVCTTPIVKMEAFINQQILLASLLGLSDIYSRQDLLGMLSIRYETPCLNSGLVRVVKHATAPTATAAVCLNYKGEYNIALCLREISFQRLGLRLIRWKGDTPESADVEWENVRCDFPYYREIVSLDATQYDHFIENWRNGKYDSDEITAAFERIKCTIAPSPFRTHDNPPSLELDLKPGIYLQIQISKNDGDKNNGLDLRMIRFGPQCHVCLLHMNHPEKAFMTDREDLKDKMPENLDAGKHGVEFLAEISWDGDYYSGGSFVGKESTIQEGDFLCIRKDTESIRGKEYVWNAHAVVLEVNTKGKVRFATCTLLQMEEIRSTGEFVIELIKDE